MNPSSLFPVVAVLVLVTCCVQVESGKPACNEEDPDIKSDTAKAMKRCNSNIKNYYDQAPEIETNAEKRERYCHGMKILLCCARSETIKFEDEHSCASEVLREYVFVSLQYIAIGKRLSICDYDTTSLKNLWDRMKNLPNGEIYTSKSIIGLNPVGQEKKCAWEIHVKCAKDLVKKESDLCGNVGNFVACYDETVQSASFPEDSSCGSFVSATGVVPEISRKFNSLINKFSTDLIMKFKALNNDMCTVSTDLVVDYGDCTSKI